MRTVTFSDAKVAAALSKDFVCAWRNIRPGEKFKHGVNEALDERHARRPEREVLPEGTGATNICAIFALPDGRIVHAVQGYANPSTLAGEIAFALQAAQAARGEKPEESLKALYTERLKELSGRDWNGRARIPLAQLARSPLPSLASLLQEQTAGLK